MDNRSDFYASNRSEDELKERIDNRQQYMPETVEASVAELRNRGHEFSDEELKIIDEDIQAHRENAALVNGKLGLFNNEYANAIVEDPDAPIFYSKRALYVFTVLMGALFGSILLAININKIGKAKQAFFTVLFGIAFTVLQFFIITEASTGSNSGLTIIFGIVAAYCLDYFFWRPFIGYATFYKARPIWTPLIIALILGSLIVWAAIYGGKQ
jgi:hypothetical protein